MTEILEMRRVRQLDDAAILALVACGAVKFVAGEPEYGEIKRVFVAEEQRGKRLATSIMQHLEEFVINNGVSIVRLEAGPKQPAALSLYRKLGYTERGPFGSYRADPLSVFMEKKLDKCRALLSLAALGELR